MANNYTLGRGELWFARYFPGTQNPDGERYLGNTPEFGATIESETLDHFNSDFGIREKDASIVLEVNRTGNFITDHISPENVALFFFGSASTVAVAGSTVTNEQILDVKKGLSYQLGMTPANPVGARKLSAAPAPNVSKAGGTPTYVAGTDYVIDLDLGRLTILTTGSIVDLDDLEVDYTISASTRSRVISGAQAVEGALRYISKNPVGENFDWYMPYVKISPNGDYALKGEEWQQIPFNIEILKKSGYEAIYIDGRAL